MSAPIATVDAATSYFAFRVDLLELSESVIPANDLLRRRTDENVARSRHRVAGCMLKGCGCIRSDSLLWGPASL
jgi:hypothetical protein